jgi:hypothetical protein
MTFLASNESSFLADKQSGGLIWAIKKHFPFYADEIARTHNERQNLRNMRQAFIGYVMQKEGIGFSAAERFVDRHRK